ncbi:hypothetical protein JXM83_00950 [Candidatus Woesearchaeota archaeon]|nr:hypothetical protein [Candidatus Woesearchaeota archaeon]
MKITEQRLNLDFDSGVAHVEFNKLFYEKSLILEVCSEFLEIFYFVFDESADYFSLSLVDRKKGDFKEAVYEFFNYLVGVQVSLIKS